MPLPAGQPPSPTDSILSRPSTSGSTSGPRPISPMTKRSSAKSFSSVDMPPPPVPAPALNSPKSLPPKVHAPTQSPKLPSARLLKSEPAPAPSLFPRSGVPYAPRRITPANSVLIPLSPAELEGYRNYAGGVGTQILKRNKRKRDDNEQQDDDDRPSKRTRDVGLIAEHYNARPEVGIVQRKESPIIGLKNFNNWVKSVLISSFAHPVLAASPNAGPMANTPARQGMRGPARGAGKVLDLGCGKGGDVIKWVKARIREYVGVDIAAVSIDQARRRHSDLRPPKFSAYFTAADCYIQSLSDVLPPGVLPPLAPEFDVVSMQFCMHYAFESEEKARTMLGNVSNWLRPGGRLVGTVPNGSWLLERLDAVPKGAQELTFGNNVYQIRFEERDHRPIYGNRYWFYLKDAVDDVPEYVVHWSNFVSLAAEYGLHPIFVKEFHDVFSENEDHAEYGPLLQHMRVVDTNGESQMDEDQWEAASRFHSPLSK
ncbi:hypothetical protein EW026_g4772 [Hermanssonia centrifuga]|uniref:mRNA cap guanine-N(7) methyltransferase n=1 Tax=Hermanssonia centrifuga TaxID=98765 RepID=A0A4S4KG55_9APHY|nr:hypothetical protein EW026_g4772 [Hermanssonia centrifuga]